MRYRLARIEPASAAKTLACVYLVLGLVVGALQALLSKAPVEPLAVVGTVVAWALGGFFGTLLIAWAYNVGAAWTRGIEVRLDPPEE